MKAVILILLFSTTFVACQPSKSTDTNQGNTPVNNPQANEAFSYINSKGTTVQTRFKLPEGFSRTLCDSNSFGHYLRELPLKEHGQPVLLYTGVEKPNNGNYLAAVDLPIPKGNLHQCADGVIRLRTDYLFSQKRFNEISFKFVSGKYYGYLTYLNGKLPTMENKWNYLLNVYNSANTTSLNQQLISKSISKLEIGDVFIVGGFPGHTVIVVDKCVNSKGEVKFMLAQSYMPAQDIQILVGDDGMTPWYDLNFGDYLYSAEYTFSKNDLKSF